VRKARENPDKNENFLKILLPHEKNGIPNTS
jgi:hypothetical protein